MAEMIKRLQKFYVDLEVVHAIVCAHVHDRKTHTRLLPLQSSRTHK